MNELKIESCTMTKQVSKKTGKEYWRIDYIIAGQTFMCLPNIADLKVLNLLSIAENQKKKGE